MAGRPSEKMKAAMRCVLRGKTPYEAAGLAGVALSTMYRSSLYVMWRGGKIDELRAELAAKKAA